MDCKTAREMIEDYRESSLDPSWETLFVGHLGQCKRCRKVLSGLDHIDQRLRAAMSAVAPPPDFAARVKAAVDRADPRPVAAPGPMWVRPALVAASLLLVLFLSWALPKAYRRIVPSKPCAQSFAIGEAFVIGDSDRASYDGETRVEVARVVRGAPELIVEAFPD
jgi:predicted anti-sigma-YlaC factor YlaD